ncbi:isochorismate synthase [Sorangium sp. So ce1036]|uniref:isochorismate synthase n=1 Tax=Sorangium sp. So ce1036 TaxID=3133328 RepID=UPI003F10BF78
MAPLTLSSFTDAPREAARLVARTVRLDADTLATMPGGISALAGEAARVWMHPSAQLIAHGVAARLELPHGIDGGVAWIQAALSSIQATDAVGHPGSGPVALGALPFDRTEPAALVVPAQLVGVTPDGAAWVTTIGEGAAPAPHLEPAEPRRRSPDSFTLKSALPHDAWCERVAAAVAEIARGDLSKVVLARAVDVEANRPLVVEEILRRLTALYPSCAIFHVDGFLGASPELLLSRRARAVASHPLAGTYAVSADVDADRRFSEVLRRSAKDQREHRFVVEAVAAALGPACASLDVPDEPSIVSLRNVMHLGTPIHGHLKEGAPDALTLAARLHPTPAVCGTPRDLAEAWLGAHEGFRRGLYAGLVGWVDARGDGDWFLGIRSATVDGARARMVAGVGVVAGSSPEAELVETQLKLQAMLAALIRP